MKDQINLNIYFYNKFIWDTYICTYIYSIKSSHIFRYNLSYRNDYFYPVPSHYMLSQEVIFGLYPSYITGNKQLWIPNCCFRH